MCTFAAVLTKQHNNMTYLNSLLNSIIIIRLPGAAGSD